MADKKRAMRPSDSNNNLSQAKRSKQDGFTVLQDLPFEDFSRWVRLEIFLPSYQSTHFSGSKTELFRGPNVTIFVGWDEVQFEVPKSLLCYHSSACEVAFQDGRQELHLDKSVSVATFKMIIQYLYLGKVIFATDPSLRELISFVRATAQLKLLGNFNSIFLKIKQKLLEGKQPTSHDVKEALKLSSDHPVRSLVVSACVLPYAIFVIKGSTGDRALSVDLQTLMACDEFAAELFRAHTKAVRHGGGRKVYDPLSEKLYII